MAGYLGSVPVPQATQHRETFTATAGQTTFNTAGYTPLFIDVYLNGVHLSPADVTATNGSDVVLAACLVNDIVDVVSYTPFEVASQTFTGTTTMDVASVGGTLGVTGVVTANAGVVVDEMTLDADTLTATDTFTIDAVSNITLDADSGIVNFKDGGTSYGLVAKSGNNLIVKSEISDGDLVIRGNDGGSEIDALTLDMSNAGTATFKRKIIVNAADGVADADYVADFRNQEATGARSFGVNIQAGSTSSDVALNINDHDASNSLFQVKGNGAVVVGNTLTLSDGELSFANGHGISFAATSDAGGMTSEILNDYEEGIHTATMVCSTSGTITLNSSFQSLSYIKVGNLVHINGLLVIGSVSSPVGLAQVSLPYTSAALTGRAGDTAGSVLASGTAANVRDFVCAVDENTALLNILLGDATTQQSDSANAIGAGDLFQISVTYRAA